MRNSGKNIVITLFITLTAFFSVAYAACKKTEITPAKDLCESITCQNGGTCFKGKCSCPGGYEGEFCQTRAIVKYLGNWVLTEKVVGSSDSTHIATQQKYNVDIQTSPGSNVDFVINNFMGNENYDNVPCRMGMNAKLEAVTSIYFGFLQGSIGGSQIFILRGEGSVNSFGTYINGTYIRSYPSATGIVTDSLNITLER
jgi:hypothetical protein